MTPLPGSPPNVPSSSPGWWPTTTCPGRSTPSTRSPRATRARPGSGPRRSTPRMPVRWPRWPARSGATHVFNAVDPRFVLTIFEGAKAAGADYLDMAMSLSSRHPSEPYAKVGVKLGDDQLAQAGEWEADGRLALVGIGVEPGPVRRVRALRRRPPVQPHRRAGHPRRRQPRHPRRGRQRGLRAGLLDVDDHRGVPQPARGVGARAGRRRRRLLRRRGRLLHAAAVRRARGLRLPRAASARSSACTSSTRRCSSCRAGSRPTRSPSSTAWARR